MPALALLADTAAEVTYLVCAHGGQHSARAVSHDALSEHAGVLTLPRSAPAQQRIAYVDNAGGALVTMDEVDKTRRVPLAIPGEHLACDASGARWPLLPPDVDGDTIATTVIHPDGDSLLRWAPSSDAANTTLLPPLEAGPVPGSAPWDGPKDRTAQRRAVAQIGDTTLILQSGEGQLIRVDEAGGTSTISVSTPLHEGGHLVRIPRWEDRIDPDRIGR